jgi:hypothetical protein
MHQQWRCSHAVAGSRGAVQSERCVHAREESCSAAFTCCDWLLLAMLPCNRRLLALLAAGFCSFAPVEVPSRKMHL